MRFVSLALRINRDVFWSYLPFDVGEALSAANGRGNPSTWPAWPITWLAIPLCAVNMRMSPILTTKMPSEALSLPAQTEKPHHYMWVTLFRLQLMILDVWTYVINDCSMKSTDIFSFLAGTWRSLGHSNVRCFYNTNALSIVPLRVFTGILWIKDGEDLYESVMELSIIVLMYIVQNMTRQQAAVQKETSEYCATVLQSIQILVGKHHTGIWPLAGYKNPVLRLFQV